MKSFLKIIALIAVVGIVGVLIVGAVAFAQGPQTDGFSPRNFASMRGHMDGQADHPMRGGEKGGHMDGLMSADMEEIMHTAIADALGMSETDFEAAMDSGKTMFDIAAEQGVDVNTVWNAMQSARVDAVQQAVDNGILTQDQADWMARRGSMMHGDMDGDMQSHGRMGGHGQHGEHDGDCTFSDIDAN